MYCKRCGEKNKDQSKYCVKCGVELHKTENIVGNEKRYNKKIIAFIGGSIVIILSLTVVGGLFAGKEKNIAKKSQSELKKEISTEESNDNKNQKQILTESINYNSNGDVTSKSEYGYDLEGNLTKEIIYDEQGNVEKTYMYGLEYKKGKIVKRIKSEKDTDKTSTEEFSYNEKGELLKQVKYDENGKTISWEEKDEEGRDIKSIGYYNTYGDDEPHYFHTENTYDENGNLTLVINYNEDGSESYREEKSYDNNLMVEKKQYYSGSNDSEVSTFEYNDAGREIKRTLMGEYGISNWVESLYDENGILVEEITHSITYTSYDGGPYQNTGEHISATSKFEYDENGNVISQITYDPDGNVKYKMEATYDGRGNQLHQTYSDAETVNSETTVEYYDNDKEKSRHHKNNEDGEESIYEYDENGNLILNKEYGENGVFLSWVENEYDQDSNLLKTINFNENGEKDTWTENKYQLIEIDEK